MKQPTQKRFENHTLKSRRIVGFVLFESLYPHKLNQPRHTHALASLSFVLAGSYLENYGRQAQTRQHSTIVIHPPQESHAVKYLNEVRILSVQIEPQQFDYMHERSVALDSSASCRSETLNWLGRRVYQEFRRTDAASELAIEGCIFEVLAEALRSRVSTAETKFPRWLRQTEEFLHANFSQSLVFEDVAKVAAVHPVHLARVFRQRYGCTVGEYVRRLRIEFALRQLSETDLALSEIAISAGFSDHSHFARTLKSFVGVTPSEYRKIHRRC